MRMEDNETRENTVLELWFDVYPENRIQKKRRQFGFTQIQKFNERSTLLHKTEAMKQKQDHIRGNLRHFVPNNIVFLTVLTLKPVSDFVKDIVDREYFLNNIDYYGYVFAPIV